MPITTLQQFLNTILSDKVLQLEDTCKRHQYIHVVGGKVTFLHIRQLQQEVDYNIRTDEVSTYAKQSSFMDILFILSITFRLKKEG